MIGRSRESTVKLNFPSVSRKHARIFFERDIYWIEDLKSSNGTFVNQKQIRKARVNIGDVLKCGDFVIRVLADDTHSGSDHDHDNPPELSLQEQPMQLMHHTQATTPEPRRHLHARSGAVAWSSKAPTHHPDSSEISSQSHPSISSISASLVKADSLIPPPVAESSASRNQSNPEVRRQSLSTAYSDNQLDHKLDYQAEISQARGGHQQHQLSTSQHSVKSEASADLSVEMRRLEISERQLLDEVNHLNQNVETLQAQLQESRERVTDLEREIDLQAKQYNEQRLTQDQVLEETKTRYSEQAHQSAALAEDNHNLKKEIGLLHTELVAQQELTQRTQQDLQRVQQQAVQSQQDRSGSNSTEQEYASSQKISELLDDNERLHLQVGQQEAIIKSFGSGSTQVHVFSLPQPNLDATHPDWARHQARLDQFSSEIIHLRKQNRRLKQINVEIQSTVDLSRPRPSEAKIQVPKDISFAPSSFAPSSTLPPPLKSSEEVVVHHKTSPVDSDSQREEVQRKGVRSKDQATEDREFDSAQASSSSTLNPAANQAAAQSPDANTGQRRAWRGML
jgi:hypothetical protein